MNNIIELDNPNLKRINSLYYKGKAKQSILKCKSRTIKNIPKENILGLGYTVKFIETYEGKSMNDVRYGKDICEYVIVSVNIKTIVDFETFSLGNEKLLLCIPICDIVFEDEKLSEEYKSNLDALNYVELPYNFKCLEKDELIKLFEFNKTSHKKNPLLKRLIFC